MILRISSESGFVNKIYERIMLINLERTSQKVIKAVLYSNIRSPLMTSAVIVIGLLPNLNVMSIVAPANSKKTVRKRSIMFDPNSVK